MPLHANLTAEELRETYFLLYFFNHFGFWFKNVYQESLEREIPRVNERNMKAVSEFCLLIYLLPGKQIVSFILICPSSWINDSKNGKGVLRKLEECGSKFRIFLIFQIYEGIESHRLSSAQ